MDHNESVVEETAPAWLESLGWTVTHGSDIAPGELAAKRSIYSKGLLVPRLSNEFSLILIPDDLQVKRAPRKIGVIA